MCSTKAPLPHQLQEAVVDRAVSDVCLIMVDAFWAAIRPLSLFLV